LIDQLNGMVDENETLEAVCVIEDTITFLTDLREVN
jgi:hypothetical protein